ncbi:MAG: NAD(P)/FAD-dependent oxidoreductase [Pyrinomonadaceae bacterium]
MFETGADIYDALIVGGGPAGTSAAIRLATSGARVLLAEQKKFPRAKLCGEFISPECLAHFAELGVLDRIMAAGGARITETVFYTRKGRRVSVPSSWFGAGNAAAALGLSRAEMDERLLARARAAGVEVLEETQATGLIEEGVRVCGVRLKTGGAKERACLSLVTIDATGRARALARRVARSDNSTLRVRKRAGLVAFKAHLEGAAGVPGQCEIYSYAGGYGGLNSVENNLSNLCFIAAAQDVKRCGGDAEKVMREVVYQNKRAAEALKTARVASEWLCVALESFGRGALVPVEGLLAIGDAASFIDPFTGSGMLMALESGELAATVSARWLPKLRVSATNESWRKLASDYGELYDERFGRRLRVCAMLRRAAFVPRLNEIAIFALGASTRVRQCVTRATRAPVSLT